MILASTFKIQDDLKELIFNDYFRQSGNNEGRKYLEKKETTGWIEIYPFTVRKKQKIISLDKNPIKTLFHRDPLRELTKTQS